MELTWPQLHFLLDDCGRPRGDHDARFGGKRVVQCKDWSEAAELSARIKGRLKRGR